MSVALILTVEKIRRDARSSFAQTVSGTDLIVGARSGAIQLLLYSVFRIGNATNNISWESVQDIAQRPAVDWVVPLSLGDSHQGYRVVGTDNRFFQHFRYGNKRSLALAEGRPFNDVFDTVIGSEVAEQLGYTVGQSIVVAHGTGNVGLVVHDKQPFRVSGILERTGTPVDRAVHVSLEGIEAMHVDWQSGTRTRGEGTSADTIRAMDLQPAAVTALLTGLKARGAVFRVQRAINTYSAEPLLAILPGVALQELWGLVGVAESALFIVSVSVVACGLINLVSVLLAGLNERRREMAILRSAGARPGHVFLLLCIESTLLTIVGVVLTLAYAATARSGWWFSSDKQDSGEVLELTWEDLIPADFQQPENPFDTMAQEDIDKLLDGSDESNAQLARLREEFEYAPVVESLDGKRVKLPAYVTPLDFDGQLKMSEFLLVPYMGACIHTPPPPANQVVYADSASPIELNSPYDPVWAVGILRADTVNSELAEAGYTLEVQQVLPYTQPETN